MLNFFKNERKIFLLSIAKIDELNYKITFLSDFKLINENYKGYFIYERYLKNDLIFNLFEEKDFNKWYNVGVDYVGNILCLYYKKWKINL